MGSAITTVFGKYATFSGRAARPEYWWWVLFLIIGNVVFSIIDGITGWRFGSTNWVVNGQEIPIASSGVGVTALIFDLAVLIPTIAVTFRRLHDVGRSGWWWLLNILCCIGSIIVFIFSLQPSMSGANQYGPEPEH
jgi:uncharacterized membrane protein YhaH (DUF805 family)